MQKKMSARIAGWLALTLAAVLAVTSVPVMNVHAEGTDADANAAATAKEALYSESYDDVNTLNATVTVKNNILKAKKNDAVQTPKPSKVVVNGVTLKLNKNYSLSYQKYGSGGWTDVAGLTQAGTYRICITGKGDYAGVATKRIFVYDPAQRIPMSAVKIKVNKVPYTGKAITDGVIKSVKYKNTELVEGRDYTVTYLSNVDSGTGVVRISGIEDVGYIGERDVKFTITGGTKLSKARVTGIKALPYNGPRRQNWMAIKVTVGGKELVYGKDYEEAYNINNNKAGTAKVVLKGKGSYYGTLTKTFKINKVKLTKSMLDEDSGDIVVKYTGKAVKPDVIIHASDGNILTKGVDYTLTYKNNVKVSDKALIVVKGKGNYTGTLNVTFTITDKDIEEKPDKEEKPSEGSGEDENPSGGDGEDGKPSEGDGEGGKPSEGDGEDEKPSEGGDEKPSEGEGGDEAGKPRPGKRVCWCGSVFDLVDSNNMTALEKAEWKEHIMGHVEAGESTSYTDKYDDGTEIKGMLESLLSRVCQCGHVMNFFDYNNMTGAEKGLWKEHMLKHVEAGESTSYTDKYSDGTEIKCVLASRVCQCGYVLYVYTGFDDISSGELGKWKAHMYEHARKGESMHYTDQHSDGTETEGVWTWDWDNGSNTGTGDGDDKSGTTKSGTRVCRCGFELDIHDFDNLTTDEIQIWNSHAMDHFIDILEGRSRYTDIYSDGTVKGEGVGLEKEGTDGDDVTGDENAQDLRCYHHKPIGFRSCTCGAICPFYVYGTEITPQSLYEGTVWNAHYEDKSIHYVEQTNYTSVSYEKALKIKAIEEDEDGNWTWIKPDAVDVAYGHVMHYHVLDSWFNVQVWNSWLGEG